MLEPIEEDFAKLEPNFTRELHKTIIENEEMDPYFKDRLQADYTTCYVGTIRDKLGLSKHYANFNYPKSKCLLCETFADRFIEEYYTKNKSKYLYCLHKFKEHLIKDHGKLL